MTSPARRDLAELPAVLNVEQAAEVLGLSRTAAYELIRSGEWPTPGVPARPPDPDPHCPGAAAARRGAQVDPSGDREAG